MQLSDEPELRLHPDSDELAVVERATDVPSASVVPIRDARVPGPDVLSWPRTVTSSGSGPVVIVRKARCPLPRPQPATAVSDSGQAAQKAPRVFRVAAPVVVLQPVIETHLREKTRAAESRIADRMEKPAGLRRRRHVSNDKRPGPVIQIAQVSTRSRIEPAAAAVDALAGGRHLPYEALLAEIVSLERLFHEIRCAGSFFVADQRFESEWERLGRNAEDIRLKIASALVEAGERRLAALEGPRRGQGRAKPGAANP